MEALKKAVAPLGDFVHESQKEKLKEIGEQGQKALFDETAAQKKARKRVARAEVVVEPVFLKKMALSLDSHVKLAERLTCSRGVVDRAVRANEVSPIYETVCKLLWTLEHEPKPAPEVIYQPAPKANAVFIVSVDEKHFASVETTILNLGGHVYGIPE